MLAHVLTVSAWVVLLFLFKEKLFFQWVLSLGYSLVLWHLSFISKLLSLQVYILSLYWKSFIKDSESVVLICLKIFKVSAASSGKKLTKFWFFYILSYWLDDFLLLEWNNLAKHSFLFFYSVSFLLFHWKFVIILAAGTWLLCEVWGLEDLSNIYANHKACGSHSINIAFSCF